MLYTRKGDNGTTQTNFSSKNLNGQAKTFNCNQRVSKSSAIAEALGSLDETNSFIGLVRAKLIALNDSKFSIRTNFTRRSGKFVYRSGRACRSRGEDDKRRESKGDRKLY